jgi:hypothetical protein
MDGGALTQGFVRRGGLHTRAIFAFSLPGEGMDPGAGGWLLWSPTHAARYAAWMRYPAIAEC